MWSLPRSCTTASCERLAWRANAGGDHAPQDATGCCSRRGTCSLPQDDQGCAKLLDLAQRIGVHITPGKERLRQTLTAPHIERCGSG